MARREQGGKKMDRCKRCNTSIPSHLMTDGVCDACVEKRRAERKKNSDRNEW